MATVSKSIDARSPTHNSSACAGGRHVKLEDVATFSERLLGATWRLAAGPLGRNPCADRQNLR
jgi:hypothetical protein